MCRKLLQLIWVCTKYLLGRAARHSPQPRNPDATDQWGTIPAAYPSSQAPDQALDQAKLSNCVAFLDQFSYRGIDASAREIINL